MKRRPLILASIAAFFSSLLGKPLAEKPDPDCYGGASIKLGNTRWVHREGTLRELYSPEQLAQVLREPYYLEKKDGFKWLDKKRFLWFRAKDEPHWSDLSPLKIEPYEPDENGSDMERRVIAEKKADYKWESESIWAKSPKA